MALNIPYSRPTPPKVTAPKLPTAPKGGGIWGPATRQQALGTPKPQTQHSVSPYDQFTLPDPYKAGQISSLAQTGYNTDVANANKLASMGSPTDASITADYAARGVASNQIQQALADHLAGVQNTTVAQGNAGSAALGQQNAAVAASSPHIAGAPVAPPLPTPAVQAVLASQTGAAGDYQGDLQRAALSSGAQYNQNAINAGTVAQQTNDTNIQRTLAQALAGLVTPSARATSMRTANQSTDAANIQTGLSIFSADETAKTAAIAAGNKQAYDAAALKEKADEARMSNTTKLKLGIASDKTKTAIATGNNLTKTEIAKAKGANGGQTASGSAEALTQAIKIIQSPGGTKTTVPSQYTVTVQPPTPTIGGKVIPGTPTPSSKSVPISAADYASGAWKSKLPKGWTVVTPAVQSKTTTATVNKPGSYTKYNRAVAYLKQTGYSNAEARRALRQWKPKAAS